MTFNTLIASHLKSDSNKTEIHLIRGLSESGEQIYTYLAIYAHRVRDLKLSLITKTTDLEEFGVILKSGIGEPDNSTKKYIAETYINDKG